MTLSTNNLDLKIERGDLVIDCGANIGDVTSFFLRQGAAVISIEPNPYAFKVLKERFKNNKRVKCINKAVTSSNLEGKIKLFFHEESPSDQIKYSTGSSLIKEKNNVNENNFTTVDGISFCKMLKKINKPIALVKMDIEGAEVEILEELLETTDCLEQIKYLLVETHEKKIPHLRTRMEAIREKIMKKNIKNINLDWV